MAYRCTKYNKILVGPRKTYESCDTGSLESKCEHRVWQNGVLKEGGQRSRGILREIWPYGYAGKGLHYTLKQDGNYHFSRFDNRHSVSDTVTGTSLDFPAMPVLTPEEMQLCKKDRRNYLELVEQKGASLSQNDS
jgi:hypothetical protein